VEWNDKFVRCKACLRYGGGGNPKPLLNIPLKPNINCNALTKTRRPRLTVHWNNQERSAAVVTPDGRSEQWSKLSHKIMFPYCHYHYTGACPVQCGANCRAGGHTPWVATPSLIEIRKSKQKTRLIPFIFALANVPAFTQKLIKYNTSIFTKMLLLIWPNWQTRVVRLKNFKVLFRAKNVSESLL
jgi:hypothetical protein